MFQISLRHLFILVAAIALVIVSMHQASELYQGLVGMLAMLAMFAAVIIGITDRGPRQLFAISFAVVMLGYALLIMNGAKYASGQNTVNGELTGWNGQLPTTVLLRVLHTVTARDEWIDTSDGKVLDSSEVASMQAAGGRPGVTWQKKPDRGTFVTTGHYWFALLFGYLGGHFARFVYGRRMIEQAANAKE
jgi:hypothetical protein